MSKKNKITSISAESEIVAGAYKDIVPPKHIRMDEDDLPFFDSVIAEFAKADWTAHQLELAALLARTMADLEREQYLLREEGSISKSDKGTPVANPRKSIVQMHAGSILSMRKSLALNARAQEGEARDVAKRRSKAKSYESGVDLEDDLIARPTEH